MTTPQSHRLSPLPQHYPELYGLDTFTIDVPAVARSGNDVSTEAAMVEAAAQELSHVAAPLTPGGQWHASLRHGQQHVTNALSGHARNLQILMGDLHSFLAAVERSDQELIRD